MTKLLVKLGQKGDPRLMVAFNRTPALGIGIGWVFKRGLQYSVNKARLTRAGKSSNANETAKGETDVLVTQVVTTCTKNLYLWNLGVNS